MSSAMTSFATSANVVWPYYTQPDWEIFGNDFRNNSGVQLLSWSPIVNGETARTAWETYSVANEQWVQSGLAWDQKNEGLAMPPGPYDISPSIYERKNGQIVVETGSGPFAPIWQMAGAPRDPKVVNFDLMSNDVAKSSIVKSQETKSAILSGLIDANTIYGESATNSEPQSLLVSPIFSTYQGQNKQYVAASVAVLRWSVFFQGILHDGTDGVYVIVDDGNCGNTFTYEIQGSKATFLGEGSLQDTALNAYAVTSDFGNVPVSNSACSYTLAIYPSKALYDSFESERPLIWTIVIVLMFVVMSFIFLGYDCIVQKRQQKVMTSAARSNAIVSSLFPAEIRDRLFGNEDEKNKDKNKNMFSHLPESSKFKLKSFLADEENPAAGHDNHEDGAKKEAKTSTEDTKVEGKTIPHIEVYETKPIADLFPNTTVMFADIAGFTAWSSVREPSQVFTLLETVYRAFDG